MVKEYAGQGKFSTNAAKAQIIVRLILKATVFIKVEKVYPYSSDKSTE
jgi:hypothetical protein